MSDLETEKRNLKFVAKCSSRSHNCEKGNFTSWKGCERLLTLTLTHPKRSTLLFGIVKYANLGSSCRRRSRDCLRFLITSYYEPGLRKLNRNQKSKASSQFFPSQIVAISDKAKYLTPHFQSIRVKRKITRETLRDIFPRIVTTAFMN